MRGGGARGRARPAPFSIRLSAEEKAQLVSEAGSRSLGAYIKSRLLEGAPAPRRAAGPSRADRGRMAELLAWLGTSTVAVNLHQLAESARTGCLDCDGETRAAIHRACLDIATMRAMLMQALGLRLDEHGDAVNPITAFARAAAAPGDRP